MDVVPWIRKYAVSGDQVIEVQAYEVDGGQWVVRAGCFRQVVNADLLSDTPEAAADRLAKLGPMPKEIR